MSESGSRILQVSPSDLGGGAELVARNLHKSYLSEGRDSWLAVGSKHHSDSRTILIENDRHRNPWVRYWNAQIQKWDQSQSSVRGIGRGLRVVRDFGQAGRWTKSMLGIEDFDFPGTPHLPESLAEKPDILHLHNLHGGFFDLTAIRHFAAEYPTILTLHDAWLLSGHCAHSFDCHKWKTSCGNCPDLTLYPSIKRDATRYNWNRKQQIFAGLNLHIAAPSNWLLDKAKSSLLANSMASAKVIPNGIDTTNFSPKSKSLVRQRLGIDEQSKVLMIAANGLRENRWKDFKTLREAVSRLAALGKVIVLAVGESGASEWLGETEIRFMGFTDNLSLISEYYAAADVYVHAANAESFGNVMLEARACGTPVVATAIGGIPEHVNTHRWPGLPKGIDAAASDEADGLLCAPHNVEALSQAIRLLLDDEELRLRLGENGWQNINNRYTLQHQVRAYLDWYQEILAQEARTL